MSPTQPDRPIVTGPLEPVDRQALVIPGLGRFTSRFSTKDLNIEYHPVPYNYQTIQRPVTWRIQLRVGAPAPRLVVGLDVYSDVVLGRGSYGLHCPDIDFTNLNALELGVSRRHALLRPTLTQLFLIDLESTNGTFVNAVSVGQGMAQVVRSGDTIALGGLNFTIVVLHSPKNFQPEVATKPLKDLQAEAAEDNTGSLQLQPDDE